MQCEDKFIVDKKIPIIYYCLKKKGHKGLHKSFNCTGKVKLKIKQTIYWEVFNGKI